jgi:thymidine kinase
MTHERWINPGILEVYYGPMKAGKGENLIHRLKPLMRGSVEYIISRPFLAFKPECDDRDPGVISSRAYPDLTIPAITISEKNPKKVLEYLVKDVPVFVFDEAQFFNEDIIYVVNTLINHNKNVILAGLDLDFRREKFGYMSDLIDLAHIKTPLYARCDYVERNESGKLIYKCDSTKATLTQRLVKGKPAAYNDFIVVTGDNKGVIDKTISYEARCEKHHFIEKPNKE